MLSIANQLYDWFITISGFASSFSVINIEITNDAAIAAIGIIAPPVGSFFPRKKVSTKASAGRSGIKNARSSTAIFTTSVC
jgi:hypothetical protein